MKRAPQSESALNPAPEGNRMLAGLPRAEAKHLTAAMEPIRLRQRQVIYESGQPIQHVYFPVSAVLSMLTLMSDGAAVEATSIGREGFVGLPILLGAGMSPGRFICQVPGDALRMRSGDFVKAIGGVDGPDPGPRARNKLRARLLGFTQAQFNLLAQSAACNRLHPVEERCARWLLMTHDRIGDDQFPLTQEFLSYMLGVRRATVTVVMGTLQKAGLVRYRRGLVTIADRAGLESASCECYSVINQEFDRLLDRD
jgi:CRP-like cAMP-binding protein